jgi:serine/threonine protein kinase
MIDQTAETQNSTNNSAVVPSELPQQIGPYRIIELLGKGGMGMVLLGESELPKRKVAIKLMLAAEFDADALSRFRQEMQVLARLEHPGIGRLYEVGQITLAGTEQPWYAMEYVPGLPLDEYVKRNQLDVKAIFQLVAKIAHALQFAHQKGVIHRDIKPANIIVDAQMQPKILDFGIARLNEPDTSGVRTRFGQIIGTLAYMSPEQLSSSTNADVRSDVYALGVVLYELLTGKLPLKISTTSLLDAIKELAEGKRVNLSTLRPGLRGEVELIVDTASNRELSQRYASAASFAADLENYLSNRPLQARRPSFGYIFGKFIRRNPILVAAISLAVCSLIGSTVYALLAAEQARMALKQAQQREREVLAVNEFLTEILTRTDPEMSGISVTMPDVLIGADLAYQNLPLNTGVRGTVALMLSMAWTGSGNGEKGVRYADWALQDLKFDEVKPSVRQIDAALAQIMALNRAQEFEKALLTLDQRLPVLRKAFSASHSLVLQFELEKMHAFLMMRRNDEALRAATAILPHTSALSSEKATTFFNNYAILLRGIGKLAEAEQMLRQQIKLSNEQDLFKSHIYSLKNTLATTLDMAQRSDEALTLFNEVIQGRTQLLGAEHPSTILAELNQLPALIHLNRQPEVLKTGIALLPRVIARFGTGDARTLELMNTIAYTHEDLGNLDLAQEQFVAVVNQHAQQATRTSSEALARSNLAMLQVKRGMLEAATAQFRQVLLIAKETIGVQHPLYAVMLSNAATADIAAKRFSDAQSKLNLAIPLLISSFGPDHVRVKTAQERLAQATPRW